MPNTTIPWEEAAPPAAAPSKSELHTLLDRTVFHPPVAAANGLLTGTLVALLDGGIPAVVCVCLSPGTALPAASLVSLDESHIGRRVALMCADGDRARPVILGLLAVDPTAAAAGGTAPKASVSVDGTSVTLSASEELVLRCGEASIVLTRSGKVLIRGAYVSSRSSGVNRVKGGSVQIN